MRKILQFSEETLSRPARKSEHLYQLECAEKDSTVARGKENTKTERLRSEKVARHTREVKER